MVSLDESALIPIFYDSVSVRTCMHENPCPGTCRVVQAQHIQLSLACCVHAQLSQESCIYVVASTAYICITVVASGCVKLLVEAHNT